MPGTLGYGYNAGLPEGARAAWGARMIAPNDLVHDRQSIFGDALEQKELLAWLNDGALAAGRAILDKLGSEVRGDERREHVLWKDTRGVLKANTNASYGYVYLCAYLHAHVPGGRAGDGSPDVAYRRWGARSRDPEVCAGTGNHDEQSVNGCDECTPEMGDAA